jgi:hypothetical protein
MIRIHRFRSRVSVRRVTRAFQTRQRYASHSETATAIAGGKEVTR